MRVWKAAITRLQVEELVLVISTKDGVQLHSILVAPICLVFSMFIFYLRSTGWYSLVSKPRAYS